MRLREFPIQVLEYQWFVLYMYGWISILVSAIIDIYHQTIHAVARVSNPAGVGVSVVCAVHVRVDFYFGR